MYSAAVFNARIVQLNLQEHKPRFLAAGWLTHADLAFAPGYVPGKAEDDSFRTDIVLRGLGDLEHKDKDKMRRLYYESYCFAAADAKKRHEATGDDAPRKVPRRRGRIGARGSTTDSSESSWMASSA